MQWCGSGAAPAGYGPAPGPDAEDCEDCVETRVHYRSVQVPCTRNVYRTESHKVPRQVSKRVPRQVEFTDFESRTKQEAYTVMRAETRYKNEVQNYSVPVKKTEYITVPVTRKVPKTIMVDQIFQEKREIQKTIMEPRQRTITVPHSVQVPETKYRPVEFKVPVKRYRTEYDTKYETVYDTVARQVCTPVTRMVTKRIPVTTVHARAVAPCPPGGCPPDQVATVAVGTSAQAIVDQHAAMDADGNGVVDVKEALAYRGYQMGGAGPAAGGGYQAAAGGYQAAGGYGGAVSYGGGASYGGGGASYGGYTGRVSTGSAGGYAARPVPAGYAARPGPVYATTAQAAAVGASGSVTDDKKADKDQK